MQPLIRGQVIPPPPPGNDGLKGQLMVLHLDVTLTVCMADRRTNDLR